MVRFNHYGSLKVMRKEERDITNNSVVVFGTTRVVVLCVCVCVCVCVCACVRACVCVLVCVLVNPASHSTTSQTAMDTSPDITLKVVFHKHFRCKVHLPLCYVAHFLCMCVNLAI